MKLKQNEFWGVFDMDKNVFYPMCGLYDNKKAAKEQARILRLKAVKIKVVIVRGR